MGDIVIQTEDLRRVYRTGSVEVHALAGVSLAIRRGELVAIMGSSGSGKSTLMALLGCLDRPSGGRYLLEGADVSALKEPELARIRSERLGFVFQSFNLLPRTSALENVALPLYYDPRGAISAAERSARAGAALKLVGLAGRERNTPAQLSGGEQQRVAIARALINAPAVVLADEPTGNLDTRNSHELMETLVRLNRQSGVTVVVVTHESDIAAYADRVVTMRDGAVIADERNRAPLMPGKAVEAQAQAPASGGAVRAMGGREGAAAGPRSWPFWRMTVSSAIQAIARNKMRSGLTTLGVLIGVAALIAMVAVGQGANRAVGELIQSLGTNMLIVLPGATTAGGVRAGFGSASTLTTADAASLRRDDPAVAQVGYMIRQVGQVQYRNQNWGTGLFGVTANYDEITNWRIAAGRGISSDDVSSAALVAVIGQTVYRELFEPYENPVGATVLVKGVPLKVIGLYQAKGQSPMGQDQDDLVTMPFTTAERKVLGVAAPTQLGAQAAGTVYPPPPNPFGMQPRLTGYVNVIYVQAASATLVNHAIDQVTATLRRRHNIHMSDTDDFSVRNLSQIATAAEGSSRVMALLLATVASISLLVGGIGIMNILLVSVTERTREIGLRMALGARRTHVLLQFLAESVFLSAAGGTAGILMGVAASELVSAVAGWPIAISALAMLGGFVFSAAVGIFFGFYPARKAAALNPIEALRYE
ncbi:MAG: ABC transporter permease [Gammaproteobacteria bacterium]|nr:ABC transporter permease [Gammaproteobacteria bacterium]